MQVYHEDKCSKYSLGNTRRAPTDASDDGAEHSRVTVTALQFYATDCDGSTMKMLYSRVIACRRSRSDARAAALVVWRHGQTVIALAPAAAPSAPRWATCATVTAADVSAA